MKQIITYRFLILRRLLQLSLITLFVGGNYWGWTILKGNFSSAILLDKLELTDPYLIFQQLFAGFVGGTQLLVSGALVLVFYFILGGRVFCSWVCPMNIVTDSSRWLRRLLKIDNNVFQKSRRSNRYWVLALSLILSVLFGFTAFEAISPISILHRGIVFGLGIEISVVVAIFLFDLLVLKDGWCGHVCPLGAFYSIVGKVGLLKVAHDRPKCTNCMKCFAVCPEKQVMSIVTKQSGQIKSGECLNCGRCIEVCDDKALKFTVNNYKNN